MKSLTKMDQSDTEQSDNQTDQDKRIIKGKADFQVSETVPAEEVPEENAIDTHVCPTRKWAETQRYSSIKINDIVRYKIDNEWVTGTILCRAGKLTGKYKTWYNVRDENNQERSIDLRNLEWEKVPETEINITAVSDNTKANDIIKAKENELDKLAQFETYEEVFNYGQKSYQQDGL